MRPAAGLVRRPDMVCLLREDAGMLFLSWRITLADRALCCDIWKQMRTIRGLHGLKDRRAGRYTGRGIYRNTELHGLISSLIEQSSAFYASWRIVSMDFSAALVELVSVAASQFALDRILSL